MAIIPPKKMQSIRFPPKAVPTATPNNIIQNIIYCTSSDYSGSPTFTIFLKLNSSPKANSKKITPMSAQVCMFAVSITEGYKPCEDWPKACNDITQNQRLFQFLNNSVIIPAQISINAKSAIKGS